MEGPQPPDSKVDPKALPREALREWLAAELGAPAFRGDQVFEWLHRHGVRDWDGMKNVPRELREAMAARTRIGGLALTDVRAAADGTRKLLLETGDGRRIESVLIPMEDRITQCVSSQVGCRIGCDFCLTGRMGLRRHLRASEIVDQHLWALSLLGEGERVANIVYMGMGEPLDNFDNVVASLRILMDERGQNLSGRRITVSTSGLVPRIAELGRQLADVPVSLAVSLNATTDEVRDRLIPINRKWKIAGLMQALHELPLPRRRRITVEYVMLRGVNDTDADARRLVRLLHGLRCKVNLIPFNAFGGSEYQRPGEARVEAFGAILRRANLTVTVRDSKGEDIGAACGQLDADEIAA